MENQENQAQDRDYKIYIPSTHQFVPVTKEVYYDYYCPKRCLDDGLSA